VDTLTTILHQIWRLYRQLIFTRDSEIRRDSVFTTDSDFLHFWIWGQ